MRGWGENITGRGEVRLRTGEDVALQRGDVGTTAWSCGVGAPWPGEVGAVMSSLRFGVLQYVKVGAAASGL
ncbi:hypothetical protein PanWU01x14_000590 [Parasponia andersonii]|uniref:Uncharacterized protein n=1 Tax=Parasponia andersonii TaxID=3476 RepID=A0A2P5E4P1_PARAD|nr:hypothetical protein PanWU01x14_000590 [Parasponia andersonii]